MAAQVKVKTKQMGQVRGTGVLWRGGHQFGFDGLHTIAASLRLHGN
jgi:hypothetical protein